MESTKLSPEDLASRWGVKLSTLSYWRWNGQGPYYIKIGKNISYYLQDIEEFEISLRRKSTSENTSKQPTLLNQALANKVHPLVSSHSVKKRA
jgi:hypothetical protein